MSEPRFAPLPDSAMTREQRKVAAEIAAGPRGAVGGPFLPLLRSPELADRVQRLGEFVRFRNSLPEPLKELAILVTARHWTAQYEWFAHRRMALEAGLAPAICDAVARGERPANLSPDETAIYDFATELVETKQVTDAAYAAVHDRFGDRGVIDLVGTLGHYGLISMVLNVARVPIPASATPLAPSKRR
jgi:4-carboxymuconolactone decarboxylase